MSTVALYGNSDPVVWFSEPWYRGVFKILWHPLWMHLILPVTGAGFRKPRVLPVAWPALKVILASSADSRAGDSHGHRWREVAGSREKGRGQGKPCKGSARKTKSSCSGVTPRHTRTHSRGCSVQAAMVYVSIRSSYGLLSLMRLHRTSWNLLSSFSNMFCSAAVRLGFYEPVKMLQVAIQLFNTFRSQRSRDEM